MSQLVNAELNSGNRIKSGTRIKLPYKDSWTPSRIAGMHYGLFNSLERKAQSFKALKYVVRLPHFLRGLGSLGRKPFLV